ncbi:MAG TPA: hypothetical protein VK171_10550, partial [Fimbriimonas sp.]|nr:hypothetical protein [Fimbriimonas sp.]
MRSDGDGLTPGDAIASEYADKQRSKAQHERKTEDFRNAIAQEITDLKAERMKLRLKAASHAGNLGLVYETKSNQFYRVIVSDIMPLDPQIFFDNTLKALSDLANDVGKFDIDESHNGSIIDVQATELNAEDDNTVLATKGVSDSLVEPSSGVKLIQEELSLATAKEDASSTTKRPERPPIPPPVTRKVSVETQPESPWQKLMAGIPWLIAAAIGCFVGYGLMMIAGMMTKKSPPFMTGVGMALGVAVMFALKILFEKIWFECTRDKELGENNLLVRIFWGFVSLSLIFAESFLGAKAIVKYSEAVAFNSTEAIPLWSALLIACTISSSSLLYSAIHGAAKAKRSITQSDVDKH